MNWVNEATIPWDSPPWWPARPAPAVGPETAGPESLPTPMADVPEPDSAADPSAEREDAGAGLEGTDDTGPRGAGVGIEVMGVGLEPPPDVGSEDGDGSGVRTAGAMSLRFRAGPWPTPPSTIDSKENEGSLRPSSARTGC